MSNEDIEKIAPIKATLYQHQINAVRFVCQLFAMFGGVPSSNGAALLMEMGTGKSLTSIVVAGLLFKYKFISKILVVAPLSILGVWDEEFSKFADFPYNLVVLKGSSEKKRQQLKTLPESELNIVVVNYESAWRLERELSIFDADLIIADEGHKLKENRTAQSKCMHHLGDQARYKLLLTGTVIVGKELDVYSQYRYANKDIFGSSFFAFRNHFFDMTGYGNHIPKFRNWMQEDFLQRMHSIAFRTTKNECLDLPEITEEIRTVELEPKAKKLYEQLEQESYASLKSGEVTAPNILTKLLRLSQVCGGYLTDDNGKLQTVSKAKMGALEDIVDSVLEEDKKLVIMARFKAELDDIQVMLEKKNIEYAVVRGGVDNRPEQVSNFQNNPKCKVFVGQIQAAGLGITLTAASTMCFYSLDFNMSNFDQARARIHRVGQKNNCHYIYLQTKDTVDKKVLKALRNKIDLAKLLVDDYRNGRDPFKN